MTAPELTQFGDRLENTLAEAVRTGALREREYEALLLDPDFDQVAFERFRAAVARAGIALPDEATDGATAAGDPFAPLGEPERDLLDIYLGEIGRIPLLNHSDLLALARRARSGDEIARKRII